MFEVKLTVKNIRIHCRCGTTFIAEIPGELLENHFIGVHYTKGLTDKTHCYFTVNTVYTDCPKCARTFQMKDGKITSVDVKEMIHETLKPETIEEPIKTVGSC